MTYKVDDRIFETSITTGTGTYTLDGPVTGYQAFSEMTANNFCPYFVTMDNSASWEAGIGQVLGSPARLSRITVLASSNSDAAVDWGVGTKNIRCGQIAALAVPRVLSKSVAGSADITLTQDEMRRSVLIFTGALTGNISVIVDATPWAWDAVLNSTSGAFTMTMKVSGQTGVPVTQGKAKGLYCDGTDVEDAYTDVASQSAPGLVELLTQAEYDAGADTTRAPTASLNRIANPAQQTASGVAIEFTGIPAGTKRIVVHGASVSTNGTGGIIVQLGDSGGYEQTGYSGGVVAGGTPGTSTTGFGLVEVGGTVAAGQYDFMMVLELQDAGSIRWGAMGSCLRSDASQGLRECCGWKALTGNGLDRVRVVNTNGTDVFDAGTISISYER